MEKALSKFLSATLVVLTVAGFTQNKKRFLGIMNIDTAHSVLRVPLTAALLYAATQADLKDTRKVLQGVGIFYLFIAIVGSADKKAGGLLPSRLTGFDIVYHYSVGAIALWMGSRSGRMLKP